MNEIVVRVENLSKIYKLYDKPSDRLKESLSINKKEYHIKHYALNNISFEVCRGETVGIIGTNGSGKSTLLKIITGVLTPSLGRVNVDGKISALLELGAGFNPEYTGLENIYLNGMMMGFTKEQMSNRVGYICDFAEIGEFINQPVKTYSSGMFARLAFAVAINVEPDILIVDEALAVGDLEFQLKCMNKFTEFRNNGKTILYVSHDVNSVKRYCNSCIWIQDGAIAAIGNTDMVTDRYLDFLKGNKLNEKNVINIKNSYKIGQINQVKILNSKYEEINSVNYQENVYVKVDYELYEYIHSPVVGVAIWSIDNKYICGLNTKLDYFTIENKIGKNSVYLEYFKFNILGGSYYFDVALFESNAHVPIEYRSKAKKFVVNTPYVGEGICILDHKWFLKGE
jgi:ABC-type polysaccharide/polyol phosphate transport system ATPase subunit